MDNDFTADEIRDVVRIARVHCLGFSEDDFESLMELERRITDSGYLEAVLVSFSGGRSLLCLPKISWFAIDRKRS